MELKNLVPLIEAVSGNKVVELYNENGLAIRIMGNNSNEVSNDEIRPSVTPSQEVSITAPILGTLYLSQTPDSEPFVSVGDTVEPGDTLFIIEAMKMFNEIKATHRGTITQIIGANDTLVEYGQEVMRLCES